MISLIKRPLGKKPQATCLDAEHLASTLIAGLVEMLPSSRRVGGGNQLQTGTAPWFTAHVAHTCLETLRKQPSEVAAAAWNIGFRSHMGSHVYTLPSYLTNCAATQYLKLAMALGSK